MEDFQVLRRGGFFFKSLERIRVTVFEFRFYGFESFRHDDLAFGGSFTEIFVYFVNNRDVTRLTRR